MITLKQMAYFEALARRLHFGQAAQDVHISQPALSAQIAELERRLGCVLIERNRGAVVLTEIGRQLLPGFRRVLDEVRMIEEQARQEYGVLSGTLKLGLIPTLAPYLLPALAPILTERFPKLEFQVREAVTETLVQQLHAGSLDAIVAALPIKEPWIAHTELFADPFYMVASENDDVLVSPLNQHRIAVDRLLLLEEGHCLRDQALALCEERPAANLVNYGATSLTTLLQMVANGMGRTLLPGIAVPAESVKRGDIRIVEFAPPVPERSIALFHRRGPHRRADFEALSNLIREIARDISRDAAQILTEKNPHTEPMLR
ncbi:MAG: LysR family transcriptional regulator [Rhizobiales bacterium]|nr:LysR family transcriptional regulator [Hyphomicrobiales bacterium]MBA68200.1 LysR family transcriptional regulator [Hyphomicrobiales bacterium]|tara:strand:- start:459 stop:1412 length:954 start_codon:yes stop_codon:yes gene_type:complete